MENKAIDETNKKKVERTSTFMWHFMLSFNGFHCQQSIRICFTGSLNYDEKQNQFSAALAMRA